VIGWPTAGEASCCGSWRSSPEAIHMQNALSQAAIKKALNAAGSDVATESFRGNHSTVMSDQRCRK